jgi:hypothetical protein
MIVDGHACYAPRNFSDFAGDRFPSRVGFCGRSRASSTCALEALGADHLVSGGDHLVLRDYEANAEAFCYINRRGLPPAMISKILHHNVPRPFGFLH